ncbi:MAG: PASTA domain-containing protein [Bacteroidetes bacterium]|nr:PASTA domain-containing protein [Bacteroidota bacterium]
MSTNRPPEPTHREPVTHKFWFHLLLVLLLSVLCYIIFFSSLSRITRHGDDTRVPALTGKDLKDAMNILRDQGFDVLVDSTFFPEQKALVVLNQIPDSGDVVKQGRIIFLTVNKSVPPQTPMPNLLNLSFRSAALILKSNRLILGDTSYRPDIAEGAILEQRYQGQSIRPGQMIPQGSVIDLIIGGGLSNELQVPDVIGLSFPEAMAMLNGSGLQFTALFDAGITDTMSAKVYKQTPNAISDLGTPSIIRQGDFVDIYMSQNPSDSLMDANRNEWKQNLYNNPPNTHDSAAHAPN